MKYLAEGGLAKMTSQLATSTQNHAVQYALPVGDQTVPMNELLGKKIQLEYSGLIACAYCQRPTKKSFNQGYCYACFQKLARCDSCMMSPEKCHYALGTCREPEWALQHCMIDHIVYLSNTSGPKVGITRANQVPTRWIDQGAIQALPIMLVKSRHQSGLLESLLKQHIADKTGWQAMLKGAAVAQDMIAIRDRLLLLIREPLAALKSRYDTDAFTLVDSAPVTDIHYPVMRYPDKVKSLDFEKQSVVAGVLQGIKGQYLLLDTGVINIRKFTAYHVEFSVKQDHSGSKY